ncbi:hypothetical protein Tco_0209927 [Tanacetum coccineum]
MREQAHSSRNRLAHLNAMILEMEAMNDPEEFYDALFYLRDDKRVEYNMFMAINDVIAKAEEKLTTKEAPWLHMVVLAFQDKGLVSGQLANLNLADLYDGLDFEMHLQFVFVDDMPIMDEVVFKLHKNGYFEFDPLRYVNGSVSSVSAFTCDRDIFPTCLDWICSEIIKYKWALFYCLPNKSLEQGLKLIHIDNDVHSFFADAERMEEDAPCVHQFKSISIRIKRREVNKLMRVLRKKAKEKKKMVDDEQVGKVGSQSDKFKRERKLCYEFPGPSPTKEVRV